MRSLKSRAKTAVARTLRARPDFLVIGAQKAGTTSLHSYLSQHEDLQPSDGPKELHYFDYHYDRAGLDWYLAHFPYRFRRTGELLFEATPDYMIHECVPARIHRDLGVKKLIAVLREPVSRAFSAWRMWHHFAESKPHLAFKADTRNFAQAISEELACKDMQNERHFHYVKGGHYADQIESYRHHFPDDQLLVLNYDDMKGDLAGFLDRICDFLDVAPFDRETVSDMGGQKLWVTPKVEMTEDMRATFETLRDYYTPHNERLFALLDSRWDW